MAMARTITVSLPGYQHSRYRPTLIRSLGERLHPDTVAAEWYAADCPPSFRPRRHALRWRIACLLRGCRA